MSLLSLFAGMFIVGVVGLGYCLWQDTRAKKETVEVPQKIPGNVLAVTFPKGRDSWGGPSTKAFIESLQVKLPSVLVTELRLAVGNTEESRQSARQTLEQALDKVRPEVVFLADDLFLSEFHDLFSSRDIHTHTVFINYHSDKKPGSSNQSGINVSYAGDALALQLKEIFNLNKGKTPEKLAILGNPYSQKVEEKIKAAIGQNLPVPQVFRAYEGKEWLEKLREIERDFDAAWVLAPFGVKDEYGNDYNHSEAKKHLAGLNIPSLGLGVLPELPRTFVWGFSQEAIGGFSAQSVFWFLSNGSKDFVEYKEAELTVSTQHLTALGWQLPQDIVFKENS